MFDVDDGEPVETEDDIVVVPGSGLVRTAVAHAARRGAHEFG
jgi:hypothetical protein